MNLDVKLRKSDACHPALSKSGGGYSKVVSVEQQTGVGEHPLLDLGATDSMTNDFCFVVSLMPVFVNLIVAYIDQFPVKQMGLCNWFYVVTTKQW
jgi:hypothetical protein